MITWHRRFALALVLATIINAVAIVASRAQPQDCAVLYNSADAKRHITATIFLLGQTKLCIATDCSRPEAKAAADILANSINARIDVLRKIRACLGEAGG